MESPSHSGDSGPKTSTSLLRRLSDRPTDQSAWAEFVARYAQVIYGWCRRWNLQDADADDVAQAVLLKLAREMPAFVYDPEKSFRGWLKTLTHHAWQDLVTRRRLAAAGGGLEDDRLRSLEARDDPAASDEAAGDQELLARALGRVRRRVQPHTWQAFRLAALEGLTCPEAAARLGVPLATVYKAKSNVKKLLLEEARRLAESARQR